MKRERLKTRPRMIPVLAAVVGLGVVWAWAPSGVAAEGQRGAGAGRAAGAASRGREPAWPPVLASAAPGELQVLPVAGNVHVIIGAGANITVQAGNQGVLLVDTGTAAMSAKVIAAIKAISPQAAALHRQHDAHAGARGRESGDCEDGGDHPVPRAGLRGGPAGRARYAQGVGDFVSDGVSPDGGGDRGAGDAGRRLAGQHVFDCAEAAVLQRRAGGDLAFRRQRRRQQRGAVPEVGCGGGGRPAGPDDVSADRRGERRRARSRWSTA